MKNFTFILFCTCPWSREAVRTGVEGLHEELEQDTLPTLHEERVVGAGPIGGTAVPALEVGGDLEDEVHQIVRIDDPSIWKTAVLITVSCL